MKNAAKLASCIIVGFQHGFPNGSGATARIREYVRGLVGVGVNVKVMCLKPTESMSNPLNFEKKGVYCGANFEYLSGSVFYSKKIFLRYFQNLYGLMKLYGSIREHKNRFGLDAIIFYGTDSFFYTLAIWIAAKINSCLLIGENTEEPFVYKKNGFLLFLKKILVFGVGHKLFDGFVVISSHLENLFRSSLKSSCKILRLPVMTDVNSFGSFIKKTAREPRVTYCGSLRDFNEIKAVIDVWSLISEDFPSARLNIIGSIETSPVASAVITLVKESAAPQTVDFPGYLAGDALKQALVSSDVLILPRASGAFSKAGLPNKLAEYLATGNPVVVTDTGDIPNYLTDKVNAFIVSPDDVNDFAKKIVFVLNNRDFSKNVGDAGREVSIQYFDTVTNCNKLISFIESILSGEKM